MEVACYLALPRVDDDITINDDIIINNDVITHSWHHGVSGCSSGDCRLIMMDGP